MNKILSIIYRHFFIPSTVFVTNLFYTIISFIKILLKSRIMTFENNPKNEIYVVGSGPSLKNILENEINKLINKDIVVFNFFAFSSYYEILKPRYYVLVDGSFWINNIDNYVQDINERKNLYVKRKKLFSDIISKTNWTITLYFPVEAKKNKELIQLFNSNKKIKIAYINSVSYNGFPKIGNWLRKKTLVGFIYQNCIVSGLYISIMNKYKKIFILGADHDVIKNIEINNKNELLLYDTHFYNDEKSTPVIISSDLYAQYKALYILYGEYLKIKDFAKYMNCEIYNATKGGMLDVFKRREI